MDWKDYFKLSVLKETPQGPHPYFHSELRVPTEFEMEELLLHRFDHLNLPEKERKNLSLQLRKILVRHHYFASIEFQRIVENFIHRIVSEKERKLIFSTQGGGIYLFVALLNHPEKVLLDKKLICYTSEFPLSSIKIESEPQNDIQFILRPCKRSFLKDVPSLWQNSHLVDLSEASEA